MENTYLEVEGLKGLRLVEVKWVVVVVALKTVDLAGVSEGLNARRTPWRICIRNSELSDLKIAGPTCEAFLTAMM